MFNTLGCFAILMLLDRVGRQMTAWICSITVVTALTTSSIIDHWYLRMILMGLANGCEGCFSNLFNVLMNESSRKPPLKISPLTSN